MKIRRFADQECTERMEPSELHLRHDELHAFEGFVGPGR